MNKTSQGQYSCQAENEAGIDQKYMTLFVAGKYFFVFFFNNLYVCWTYFIKFLSNHDV